MLLPLEVTKQGGVDTDHYVVRLVGSERDDTRRERPAVQVSCYIDRHTRQFLQVEVVVGVKREVPVWRRL